MIDFDSFISEDLMSAPEHPLAPNLELTVPDDKSASGEEIREIQRRVSEAALKDHRIPGIVKRIIPLDTDTYWEYWWCVPGRMLLPEDVELLKRDRPRVEKILEKLVWLFGGYCFYKDSSRDGEQIPVHDWQDVLKFAYQQGFDESYLLDIDFLPLAIKRTSELYDSAEQDSETTPIAVEPAHWHIEFLQLIPTEDGCEIQEPKEVCSCQIWTGKPFIKHQFTGASSVRYDLWVSRPLDITQPPWLE